VYPASLLVVPWHNLTEYKKYNIPVFTSSMVSIQHCKPFKGEIQEQQVVDPILLNKFLSQLGANEKDEIVSVLDSEDHPIPSDSFSDRWGDAEEGPRVDHSSDEDDDDDDGNGSPQKPQSDSQTIPKSESETDTSSKSDSRESTQSGQSGSRGSTLQSGKSEENSTHHSDEAEDQGKSSSTESSSSSSSDSSHGRPETKIRARAREATEVDLYLNPVPGTSAQALNQDELRREMAQRKQRKPASLHMSEASHRRRSPVQKAKFPTDEQLALDDEQMLDDIYGRSGSRRFNEAAQQRLRRPDLEEALDQIHSKDSKVMREARQKLKRSFDHVRLRIGEAPQYILSKPASLASGTPENGDDQSLEWDDSTFRSPNRNTVSPEVSQSTGKWPNQWEDVNDWVDQIPDQEEVVVTTRSGRVVRPPRRLIEEDTDTPRRRKGPVTRAETQEARPQPENETQEGTSPPEGNQRTPSISDVGSERDLQESVDRPNGEVITDPPVAEDQVVATPAESSDTNQREPASEAEPRVTEAVPAPGSEPPVGGETSQGLVEVEYLYLTIALIMVP